MSLKVNKDGVTHDITRIVVNKDGVSNVLDGSNYASHQSQVKVFNGVNFGYELGTITSSFDSLATGITYTVPAVTRLPVDSEFSGSIVPDIWVADTEDVNPRYIDTSSLKYDSITISPTTKRATIVFSFKMNTAYPYPCKITIGYMYKV